MPSQDPKKLALVTASEQLEVERSALMRNGQLSSFHWIMLALSFVVTIGAWQFSKTLIRLRTEVRFDYAVNQIPELVRQRLQKYELALLAGVAAVNANGGDVDWAEWSDFAGSLDIKNLYPGINGIGLIHEVSLEELEGYLTQQRVLRSNYDIHPPHEEDIYQPISYIYPVEANIEAVGLDMVHEINRHTSLNKARDTGTPQITGPIILVQDAARTPGFLFFAPIYGRNVAQTVAERQTDFVGAVYAPFIVSQLIGGTLDQERRTTMIRISDGDEVIYDEITPADINFDSNALGEKRIFMDLYGRQWHIDIRAGLSFRADNLQYLPGIILAVGIVIDLALLELFVLLTRANRRGLRFADMATVALQDESQELIRLNNELVAARKKAESVGAMKSEFLSTMSHEVRTPLTAISGILLLLDRAKLPEHENNLVQAGKTASEKLLKLLTDVLDISKLEANAVQLWEREIALRPIIDEWSALAKGMIEELGKDISVKTNVSDLMPEKIIVDDIRLAQVMNNLMDNAIRFTERGSIVITASSEGGSADLPLSCSFTVTDTGTGIPKEDLSAIFERFKQLDGSITRVHGGSGLGLAICRDLVKLLGGEISVSSELGIGTTFKVRLPVGGARLIRDASEANTNEVTFA